MGLFQSMLIPREMGLLKSVSPAGIFSVRETGITLKSFTTYSIKDAWGGNYTLGSVGP